MIPDDLHAWLRPHLGSVVLRPAAGAHGRVQTWEVEAGPDRYFVRWGRSARKQQQEVRVAREVWPVLRACPTLVHADEAGLLMTACRDDRPLDREAWRAAGRVVRRLHGMHVGDDPLPLADAIQRRVDAAADRLRRHGEPVPSPPPAPRRLAPRAWCHRDLSGANLCWDGAAISLVDWEHARPDWPTLDLARVACALEWHDFLDGYGPLPDDGLALALYLHGLSTLAWGLDHGDGPFVAEGRRVLEMLRDGPDGG